MRTFILALALSLPLGLAACADSPEEEAMEEGAPAGDVADTIGDGEIIDEPVEEAREEAMEEGAPAGDAADVIGDGEIIDEPGEPDADALGQ